MHSDTCDCAQCVLARDGKNLRMMIQSLAKREADRIIGERASRAVRKSADRSNDSQPVVIRSYTETDDDGREWTVNVIAPQATPKRNEYNSVARRKVTGDARVRQYVPSSANMLNPHNERSEYDVRIDLWCNACEELKGLGIPRHLWPKPPKRFL